MWWVKYTSVLVIAIALALIEPGVPNSTHPATATATTASIPGCAKTYTRTMFRKAARRIMKTPRRANKRQRNSLHRFLNCQRSGAPARAEMQAVMKNWRKWRNSYDGYWYLRFKRISKGQFNFMMSVHNCESINWYLNGHHDGGFQYDERTWWEAQNWDHTPMRYRRAPAYNAHRHHQIVVTASFMPGHLSRWTASRHCWG